MALLNVDLQAITSFSDSRLVSMRRRARELAEERHPSFHAVVTSIDTELQRRYLARVDSKALYEIAKAQPVGSEVVCPHCLMEFTKRKSSQAFCSNARSHGADNCKDGFWNSTRNLVD